ncbi:embryonic polarity protein dorsal-like isoform X3 [Diaphorina citri]|uniref:Embryonic polarity protein dorsal-like isoform X3 n=1 Tax=Diaphorina citri TaxID=121845 RepID=A0A1S4ESQ9_DIACI|nr:embryonic polarity protein dorsal-like isoform X3 [Diaphorina citri]KAI5752326.1 hypothetical protein M8J77_015957 [Diaphorina citri]
MEPTPENQPTISLSDTDIAEFINLMQSQVDQSMDSVQSRLDASRRPYIEILEQPKSKVRFRYECEGRSAGSIMGANSTLECKSYPKIMIRNYVGDAHLVVSCVSKDSPYRSHPHKLVSKDNCTNGIFCATLLEGDMTYSFTNLGIQCMKKKDIQASLQQREKQRVDPFGLGFNNRDNLDLNAVRLCFQAYLPKDKDNVIKLEPVVSDIIYDAKTYSDLTIHTLSHVSAPVVGDMKMIILCDKVNKDDIEVRFYEEQDGVVVWDERVKTLEVHKQYAIVLKTPAYKSFEINDPVHVKIQLVTKKDISEPYNFMLTPLDSDDDVMRKKRKVGTEYFQDLKNNTDPELKKKRKRPSSSSQSLKVEQPDQQYHYLSPSPVPGTSGLSPYHPHSSRTPSPSFASQYRPNVYQQPFSPESASSQAVFVNAPASHIYTTSPDHSIPYPISPHNNPVYVPDQTPPPGADLNYTNITNMDTHETSSYRTERCYRTEQDSLNEVDSADLLNPEQLSQNLHESLIISENPNMSDSLTNIANQAFNNMTADVD